MRNRKLRGITFSLKVKVVLDEITVVLMTIVRREREHGVSILLLSYCCIPGIG
jgi:hypothetical protein